MDGGTERSEFSTTRVKNAIPAIDIGTTAAAMPMLVPVISRVKGTIDAIRIRNGSDRPTLMTQLSGACSAGFSNSPPGARLCTSAPNGTPTDTTITITMPTMVNVSSNAGNSSPGSSSTGTFTLASTDSVTPRPPAAHV